MCGAEAVHSSGNDMVIHDLDVKEYSKALSCLIDDVSEWRLY